MQGPLASHFIDPPVMLAAGDAKLAKALKAEIVTRLREADQEAIAEAIRQNAPALDFLAAAFELSPYLRDCALIRPELLARILAAPFTETMERVCRTTREAWQEAGSDNALMDSLRIAKREMALALGLADLGGWMKAEEITRQLSLFADAALGAACDHLLLANARAGRIELVDDSAPSIGSGLIVLGMGKYGAFELNYSSDIDIILFFDTQAGAQLKTDDPTSLFVRLAKQLSRIMQERTGEGYVFRTDLRLRPDPGSTPLAIPLDTAFNYYEAYGQNWERAAFIKARAVAGDMACGKAFLSELSPFVWRKHLDFAAIQDVHSIKRQIHIHKGHGEVAVEGHNVKLGRGGIREIEFFAQTQQLIAGGRRPQLRKTGTIDALDALAEDGWIDRRTASELASAYWYLRMVEHRIQMVADEQSHVLPETAEGLERIARMMGHRGLADFRSELVATMRLVETHYAALFEAAPDLSGESGNLVFTGEDDDPATLETLSRLGFRQPSQVISTIRGWHYGRIPAVRTAQARELLTELTPSLIGAFASADNPDHAFFEFDRFLSGLPAGIQLFSILKSNPNLTGLLTEILGSAPRLAAIITRRPHVFDGLIDPSFGAGLPTREVLRERLSAALERAPGYEAQLDQARLFAAEQKFLIGIRLINRAINARQAGQAYSDLAEVLLESIVAMVRAEFEIRHGRIKGGEIAIIGMGRLGGRELTAGSDLDLIFLYRHDEDAEASDGEKELYPQQYFTRLVQRLIAAMSAPTAEGVVYELDFRLRPSGNAGPLATYFDSFVKYQSEEAWTWENQALTRARFVAGDTGLGERIDTEIARLLGLPRDKAGMAGEIAGMRTTLDEEKPASSVFDVKLAEGGMLDIEFIAQWGLLAAAPDLPVPDDRSTVGILDALPDSLLPPGDRDQLKKAHETFNTILQLIRVCLDGEFDPEEAGRGLVRILAEQTGVPGLQGLEQELIETQAAVRAIFKRLVS